MSLKNLPPDARPREKLLAVLELARRAMAQKVKERGVFLPARWRFSITCSCNWQVNRMKFLPCCFWIRKIA